jgi:spectrin alpha
VSSFRWQKLKAALVERRSKLGESQNIQQVTRDAEDIEAWISEKLQSVQDESYMDPSNLQVNIDLVFMYTFVSTFVCFSS